MWRFTWLKKITTATVLTLITVTFWQQLLFFQTLWLDGMFPGWRHNVKASASWPVPVVPLIAVSVHSADGNYEVTLMTKATVYFNGLVVWQPPAVYKSSCAIDVEYFPYDVQTCVLKLGSWTYDGFKVIQNCVTPLSVYRPIPTPWSNDRPSVRSPFPRGNGY